MLPSHCVVSLHAMSGAADSVLWLCCDPPLTMLTLLASPTAPSPQFAENAPPTHVVTFCQGMGHESEAAIGAFVVQNSSVKASNGRTHVLHLNAQRAWTQRAWTQRAWPSPAASAHGCPIFHLNVRPTSLQGRQQESA